MSIVLNELQVYRLKVGLVAHRWSEPSNLFGKGAGIIQPGSHCYLDRVTSDGWALFHLFGEDCKGLYVKLPTDYADDQLEEVLDEAGKPVTMTKNA